MSWKICHSTILHAPFTSYFLLLSLSLRKKEVESRLISAQIAQENGSIFFKNEEETFPWLIHSVLFIRSSDKWTLSFKEQKDHEHINKKYEHLGFKIIGELSRRLL